MRVASDTRALVTGASRGIGRAVTHALASRGATVGLASRSESELEALASELPGAGKHVALPCDVGDREAVDQAVKRFVERTGGIDLAIANAGVAHYGQFADVPLERAEEMTRVNWLGTLYLVSASLAYMLDRAEGHIVIVSSGAALRSFPSAAVYGATKAAQRAFGEALRHELSGTGVGLTVVYPGEIATALHDHEKHNMPAWYRGGEDAESAESTAQQILAGVERDARAVYHPSAVRALRVVHGLSPQGADRLLRVLRGVSAAPRVD